jgi:acetolactate synthase-1/2/3 large subunit
LNKGDFAGIAMDIRESTVAQLLAATFAANGVKHIFGIPGGGSSLDVIQAAADNGIEFVLTRTESAAVMMAAATAELTHSPGVALTTKGPGVANAVNGIAYAALDRAPVILLTDGFTSKQQTYITHQVFDQQALTRPLAKGFARLSQQTDANEVKTLIQLAMSPPYGPVHIELTGDVARSCIAASDVDLTCTSDSLVIDEAGIAAAVQLLNDASRPVVIVGLELRDERSARCVRQLVEALNCPVLTTYKAKGVIPDTHSQYVGIFTGGAVEHECVSQADLIMLCGVDPVEFVLQPWRYEAPVIDIGLQRHTPHYTSIDAGAYGPVAEHLALLTQDSQLTEWSITEISGLRERMLVALQYPDSTALGPQQVVEMAEERARSAGLNPRITVDAGAHMFSAMAFWRCGAPMDVLISNGLATMAFALPAAIAASLHDPDRPVIAFTGDGGLMMCLGDLLTAVQQRTWIIVIVFNDESLSLIDIKQQQRDLASRGVRWDRPEIGPTMAGLGGRAFQVCNELDYRNALDEAITEQGPVLIDVAIDPHGYPAQLKALRG